MPSASRITNVLGWHQIFVLGSESLKQGAHLIKLVYVALWVGSKGLASVGGIFTSCIELDPEWSVT